MLEDSGQIVSTAVKVEREGSSRVVRLPGEASLATAAELKSALLQCAGCGSGFVLDLRNVETIDVSILQLVWAAAREAGPAMETFLSGAAAAAAREMGFDRLPGWPDGRQ